MCRGKYYVEKFVGHIEDKVKRFYAFRKLLMTELTDILKRGHKATNSFCFKELNYSVYKKVRDQCHHCTCLYRGAACNNCNF